MSFPRVNVDDIIFDLDLSTLQTDKVGLVYTNLETVSAYANYDIELCGSYSTPNYESDGYWPINLYIATQDMSESLSNLGNIYIY